ncbi:MAG: hypothetical protein QW514_09460 [Thermoprotei archaeon]
MGDRSAAPCGEATGLVNALSFRDVFMFNIFFTSIFLALVSVYEDTILEGAGANHVPGPLLSTLIFDTKL